MEGGKEGVIPPEMPMRLDDSYRVLARPPLPRRRQKFDINNVFSVPDLIPDFHIRPGPGFIWKIGKEKLWKIARERPAVTHEFDS
jgi:hypothetical protein